MIVRSRTFSITCMSLLHLATSTHYGYFRDALYYLACSEHLAFGYVDQPPLNAFEPLLWGGHAYVVLRLIKTESNQRTSELLSLGTAALHGRHRDSVGRRRERGTRTVRVSNCRRNTQQSLRLSLREPSHTLVQRFEMELELRMVQGQELALM
jgi:hypothetical protein